MKQCATCYWWMGDEHAYRAECGLGAAYGHPAFDDGCAQHRPRGVPRRTISISLHVGTPRELMDQLTAADFTGEAAERVQRGLVQ